MNDGGARVGFYVLDGEGPERRLAFACRLAEKALSRGHRVFIQTEDEEQARALGRKLWELGPEIFIPHTMLETEAPGREKVAVGTAEQLPLHDDMLINLAGPPGEEDCRRFSRISEILCGDERSRAGARESWRRYRALGLAPETHRIGTGA